MNLYIASILRRLGNVSNRIQSDNTGTLGSHAASYSTDVLPPHRRPAVMFMKFIQLCTGRQDARCGMGVSAKVKGT